uniref:Integrase, catalytic region, zinc finger, CCHC-type, peptidase aspartic, catalytic n=1 Tax=Tanacetum cinerariifolium TaxID=118510 RepID=A0A6L2JZH8_TANCI|nr:integrase, catalytic region, zinc finger, CCHC-type, peptidase aspartic, catalytic [Tanacetum cinerariifolium]
MINLIKNGYQPLPCVTQVSIAGTSSTEQLLLKDKSMWSDQEKKIQKIDHLARYLLIQRLLNDIYSLIDSNKTAKDLCDSLARHMLGSEYDEQDRKAAVLYQYETFKATKGELLLDTYIQYLQVINDLKKCGYSKDNCELNFKFLNNLQPEWKQYATMMRQNKNLMDTNIDALYNILKQNQGDFNDAMGLKKKTVVVTSDPLALIAKKTKVSKRKEKVIVSSDSERSDADDFKARSLSADDKISKVSYYLSESESESEYETLEYYDNTTTYGLFVNDNDDQEIFHDCENFPENLIESQIDHNELAIDHNESEGADDKSSGRSRMMRKSHVRFPEKGVATYWSFDQSPNTTDAEVGKPKVAKEVGGRKMGFKNPSYFEKAKDLRPSLYDEKVIGLGYTLMFLTNSDEALEIEKFKRARENKIRFAYDYGSLNASYVNEKINFLDDYFQEIINPDFEKIDYPFQQTSSLNPYVPNVIAPGMFKLSVSQSVSPSSMSKTSCASKNVENLDTFSSVRRSNHSGVIWKNKGSSNISNVDLSSVSHLKLNKDVKRYSRKDLLPYNNSHLGETSSAYVCNDATNVSCNSRLCDSFSENNLFIFDDESVRISPVSKMPFRKKPCNSFNDEASDVIISFIKKTQVNLQLQVQRVRTDNGTEFKNKTIAKFFDEVGITQQFYAARTPQQNGVVERRNQTLVEAVRTMLTFANLPLSI